MEPYEGREPDEEIVMFTNWFNPHNIDHIKEYVHLMDHGFWRDGFKPDHVLMDSNWSTKLRFKMAECWIEYMLEVGLTRENIKKWLKERKWDESESC